MSSTAKAKLVAFVPHLETLFANAHPEDAKELVQEIRDHLSRLNSAAKAVAYGRHGNTATACH